AYPLAEALWVVEHGATDVVVAYPTADRSALSRLATDEQAREAITVMVDETAQLDLILDAARARSGAPVLSPRRRIRVAIELDAAYSPLPGCGWAPCAPRCAAPTRCSTSPVRCRTAPVCPWSG